MSLAGALKFLSDNRGTLLTAAFALVLTVVAHTDGWPVVEGGSARLTDALCALLERHGATVHCSATVTDLAELPASRVTVLDTSTRSLASIARGRLSARTARALARFEQGPGVCKVDWALSGPVPWTAPVCRAAATVHVGGTFEEVATAEAVVAAGGHPERPFCLVVQPCVADPTRAPAGHHTLWAYCHVPPVMSPPTSLGFAAARWCAVEVTRASTRSRKPGANRSTCASIAAAMSTVEPGGTWQ